MTLLVSLTPRRMHTAVLAVLLAGSLSACSSQLPHFLQVPPSTEPSDAAARQFLAYSARIAQMDGPARAQEQTRLQAEPLTPPNMIDLALIMGQSEDSADLSHALSLLDTVSQSKEPETAPWQPLSRFLTTLFSASAATRQRLHDQIDRQTQQLHDTQGKLDQANDRNNQLNTKLDALKAIELSLSKPNAPAKAATNGGGQ